MPVQWEQGNTCSTAQFYMWEDSASPESWMLQQDTVAKAGRNIHIKRKCIKYLNTLLTKILSLVAANMYKC